MIFRGLKEIYDGIGTRKNDETICADAEKGNHDPEKEKYLCCLWFFFFKS